ncbi:MAG TPA: DUF669 domain-containing protein [Pseudothermotoga sp.]|nr:DUF669 domain-containing protein [Pseudothermotoga sp.]
MRIDIDLTQIPDLRPLPTGTYIVRITDVKLGESQAGKPKMTLETEVLEPQSVAQEIPKWFFTLSLAEGALFRVKDLFKAVGRLHGGGFDTSELIGETVGVSVVHEISEMTGRPQNQIVRFIPAAAAKPDVSPEAIRVAKEAQDEA